MKHIIEINGQSMTLTTEELKELWTELNQFFAEKVTYPTLPREVPSNPWKITPMLYKSAGDTGDYSIPCAKTTDQTTDQTEFVFKK